MVAPSPAAVRLAASSGVIVVMREACVGVAVRVQIVRCPTPLPPSGACGLDRGRSPALGMSADSDIHLGAGQRHGGVLHRLGDIDERRRVRHVESELKPVGIAPPRRAASGWSGCRAGLCTRWRSAAFFTPQHRGKRSFQVTANRPGGRCRFEVISLIQHQFPVCPHLWIKDRRAFIRADSKRLRDEPHQRRGRPLWRSPQLHLHPFMRGACSIQYGTPAGSTAAGPS